MAFTLPDLPFAKDALAPHMSAETLDFHHGKHHKAYVDKVNALVAEDDAIARALLARALIVEGPIYIDLADAKAEIRAWLEAQGFAAQRPFTRMVYGMRTGFDDPARTFAVVGPEFG